MGDLLHVLIPADTSSGARISHVSGGAVVTEFELPADAGQIEVRNSSSSVLELQVQRGGGSVIARAVPAGTMQLKLSDGTTFSPDEVAGLIGYIETDPPVSDPSNLTREQREALAAHDQPIPFDPFGQAIPGVLIAAGKGWVGAFGAAAAGTVAVKLVGELSGELVLIVVDTATEPEHEAPYLGEVDDPGFADSPKVPYLGEVDDPSFADPERDLGNVDDPGFKSNPDEGSGNYPGEDPSNPDNREPEPGSDPNNDSNDGSSGDRDP